VIAVIQRDYAAWEHFADQRPHASAQEDTERTFRLLKAPAGLLRRQDSLRPPFVQDRSVLPLQLADFFEKAIDSVEADLRVL
jgi:hypothetical protein